MSDGVGSFQVLLHLPPCELECDWHEQERENIFSVCTPDIRVILENLNSLAHWLFLLKLYLVCQELIRSVYIEWHSMLNTFTGIIPYKPQGEFLELALSQTLKRGPVCFRVRLLAESTQVGGDRVGVWTEGSTPPPCATATLSPTAVISPHSHFLPWALSSFHFPSSK